MQYDAPQKKKYVFVEKDSGKSAVGKLLQGLEIKDRNLFAFRADKPLRFEFRNYF